jgi:hypothetical protein
MRILLIVAAILVGLANATLYSLIGNNTFDNLFEWHRDPWSLYVLYAFSAVFVGLLVSASLVRFAEEVFEQGFFSRYGLLVMAICIGGGVLAVFLTTLTFLFDPGADAPKQISETFYTFGLIAVQGAMLGAVEGVVLALPLSWLLGLFEKPGAET